MKIGQVQNMLSTQMHELQDKRSALLNQKKKIEESGANEVNQGLIEELAAVDKEYNQLSSYMDNFTSYRTFLQNTESAKQQGEAMKKGMEDIAKCMEIARRISNGDHVPPSDEEKLMNFSMELYIMAKNAAMMHANEDAKDYDSLWDDEEGQKGDDRTAEEIVDDREYYMEIPQIEV